MKRGILILLLTLAGALAGSAIYYTCATSHARAMLLSPRGGLEWLRAEFSLNEAQFAQIEALHRDHAVRCDELCSRVEASSAEAARLIGASDAVTPEIESALASLSSAETECRRAMLEHIYEVSARMSPENGERYIERMKPHVLRAGPARHGLRRDGHS